MQGVVKRVLLRSPTSQVAGSSPAFIKYKVAQMVRAGTVTYCQLPWHAASFPVRRKPLTPKGE